jgi:hypothetical protein
LGQILSRPSAYRLTREQVESAWEYAYRFFFDYPRPFPWHLVRVWDDYKARPLSAVCSPEGLEQYGETFKYLVGEPINWRAILQADGSRKDGAASHLPESEPEPVSTGEDRVEGPQAVIPHTGGRRATAGKKSARVKGAGPLPSTKTRSQGAETK